jgi:hypothetical protein
LSSKGGQACQLKTGAPPNLTQKGDNDTYFPHWLSHSKALSGSLGKSFSHFWAQDLQAVNSGLSICWHVPLTTPHFAY